MTFAAIADVHGNLPALEAVLADIGARGIDTVVNLGDLVSGPLWPAETADRLEPLNFTTIRGNHERQLLTLSRAVMGPSDQYATEHLTAVHRTWLASLPASHWFLPDVFLCHGTPESDLTYFLHDVYPDRVDLAPLDAVTARASVSASLILCAHTHLPGELRLADGRLIANPGSVGLPGYTADLPYPHAMAAGTPHARYAILSHQGGMWHAEQIALPYDWESAARQAERNGRPDWATPLRTGLT